MDDSRGLPGRSTLILGHRLMVYVLDAITGGGALLFAVNPPVTRNGEAVARGRELEKLEPTQVALLLARDGVALEYRHGDEVLGHGMTPSTAGLVETVE
jgi:hypothetical protein